MSIFDGIETAQASRDGNFIRPGTYNLLLMGVRQTKRWDGVVFVAIESRVTEVLDDDEGRGHRVGEEITHLLKVSSPSFLGNFKQFAAAVCDVSPDQITKAESDRITSEEQPFAGVAVKAKGRQIQTRQGKPFTKVIYEHLAAA